MPKRSSKGPVRPSKAQGNSKQTVRQGKDEKYHSLQVRQASFFICTNSRILIIYNQEDLPSLRE